MRVTMEDLFATLTLCIIMIFIYSLGYVGAVWSVTIVAIGLVLLLFKCRLELCYITEDRVIYQSKKRTQEAGKLDHEVTDSDSATCKISTMVGGEIIEAISEGTRRNMSAAAYALIGLVAFLLIRKLS